MSLIRRLVDQFYPPIKNGYVIPVLGLDACGKTTVLHCLKLGEIVVTAPTIGLEIETAAARFHGRPNEIITLKCWDVGGCGKHLPISFVSHYTGSGDSDALIWLVDSCDRERLLESVEELDRTLRCSHIQAQHINIGCVKLTPLSSIATKQDLPNPMSIDAIQRYFADITSGLRAYIVGATRQSLDDGALRNAFNWLQAAIENVRAGNPPNAYPAVRPDPRPSAELQTTLDAWLVRAGTDYSPEVFLQQFETLRLPAWDHYTHIRAAYLLLAIFDRQKGERSLGDDLILQGVEKYISQSAQTHGRTFHVTMTYFWIQIVHFGICSMSPRPSDWTLVDEDVDEKKSGDDDFARFLLRNPFVVDGNLWAVYYSKDRIMSAAGERRVLLPDKKPLPNIVGKQIVTARASATGAK
ncbi:ADP-ribosylation factor family-domain-containing protein [Mycena sp. CBHHK59/15]|nr:ADP-ribosylation factor family-domain-containing protein [Mycena sp. CBHHK59/15]